MIETNANAPAVGWKRVATATARCALIGVVLSELHGDDGRPEFIATRWALTRAFRSIADVEAWLDEAEGRIRAQQAPR